MTSVCCGSKKPYSKTTIMLTMFAIDQKNKKGQNIDFICATAQQSTLIEYVLFLD